ncbi:tyrosine recombinase [Moniliophthora roreri MCA 2997]|uniref:Tyrosine recombinase n=1 Tax=Moniliophthora roreri (strain MCA 2997) TaxID=1381753 RepID=V2XHN3_MONRO|nr:tyrosine recombinase [Moniliophthora roreri MCA 2997]
MGDSLPNGHAEEFDDDFAFPLIDHASNSPQPQEDLLYTYNFSNINIISQCLGYIWETLKDINFCFRPVYFGFEWDMSEMIVSVPLTKCEKYLSALNDWDSHASHNYEKASSIYGKLLHLISYGGGDLCQILYQHPSQVLQNSSIYIPTQTPAEAIALAYAFVATGERISSSQVGKETTTEISDRQKQWDSGYLSGLLLPTVSKDITTRSMETTKGLLKGGGMVEAETDPQTIYSDIFTKSLKNRDSISTPNMSQLTTTLQTHHHEASMVLMSSSSHQSPSLTSSIPLSSTMTHSSPNQNIRDLLHGPTNEQAEVTGAVQWPAAPPSRVPSSTNPHPYPAHLPLHPSNLRPHCLAKDQLILWKPINQREFLDHNRQPIDVSKDDLSQLLLVLSRAYAESTLQSHATGLLVYHVFCDTRNIPEDQRAPASPSLISLWISTIAGTYSGAAIKNFVYGVRAWHVVHGTNWQMKEAEMKALLRASVHMTPGSLKKKKRQPWTIPFIKSILEELNPDDSIDAVIAACLTTTFYSGACLGEFTVPKLNDFHPDKYITWAHMSAGKDRNSFEVTIFHIPRTKLAPEAGEDVYWAIQNRPTNPNSHLENHFQVNNPTSRSYLFTYQVRDHAKAKGLEPLQGHGIHIGATLEYLLQGVPFDMVKSTFQWKSDAFLTYLRKHAEIMAPYMQPQLHQEFIQHIMPPVR